MAQFLTAIDRVTSASEAEDAVRTLMNWFDVQKDRDVYQATISLALAQMARRTGDRFRDLGDATRTAVVQWLGERDERTHWIELVREGGSFDVTEQSQMIGDALPLGISLRP